MYKQMIREITQDIAPLDGIDPRHVEAYMRVERSTFDSLSRRAFRREVEISVACVLEGGTDMAERVAQSFGL